MQEMWYNPTCKAEGTADTDLDAMDVSRMDCFRCSSRMEDADSMKIKLKKKEPQSLEIKEPVTWNDIDDEYDPYKHGITQSMLATFAMCPQKFRLAYVERWTSVKTGRALDFGNIVHGALEEVYTHRKDSREEAMERLTRWLAKSYTADRNLLTDHPTGDPNEFDELEEAYGVAQVTLEEYIGAWLTDAKDMKWVALEKIFEVPWKLKNGKTVMLRGKRDGDWRTKSGDLWLMETKTKGRIEEDALNDKMSYDVQVQLYMHAQGIEYREEPGGVLYNLIRRSQLRKKNDERRVDFLQRIREHIRQKPDWYFIRNHISFFPDERKQWLIEFGRRVEMFMYAWENRMFYRESGACDIIGRKCPFICMCSGGGARGIYQREKTFTELEVG